MINTKEKCKQSVIPGVMKKGMLTIEGMRFLNGRFLGLLGIDRYKNEKLIWSWIFPDWSHHHVNSHASVEDCGQNIPKSESLMGQNIPHPIQIHKQFTRGSCLKCTLTSGKIGG